MNQKPGLTDKSKLPDDGDPWAPNNLLTPEQTCSRILIIGSYRMRAKFYMER